MKLILDVGGSFGFGVAETLYPHVEAIVPTKLMGLENIMPTVDLVVFGGGADIHPRLYNHENVASSCGDAPSRRDIVEMAIWNMAKRYNKPKLGI